ncbi:hypothetical protein K280104A7_15270 [Candidatus Bariatricus faecipullorum]
MKKSCQRGEGARKRLRCVRFLVPAVIVLFGACLLFFLCRVRTVASAVPAMAMLPGYAIQSQNPLTDVTEEETGHAVKEYYDKRSREQGYAEQYENLQVYAKEGNRENTWIVFARYEMKIEDIYTPVPGLGTFFAVKEEGTVRLNTEAATSGEQAEVQAVASHEDVQNLFRETEAAYQNALRSDALLAEALEDLQKAAGQ